MFKSDYIMGGRGRFWMGHLKMFKGGILWEGGVDSGNGGIFWKAPSPGGRFWEGRI